MKSRTLMLFLVLTTVSLGVTSPTLSQQPNIIVINLDDADADLLSDRNILNRFPQMARIVTEGLRFTNLHVTTPICGPSRACFLRCQHAHRTGIRVNAPNHFQSSGFDGGMKSYFDAGFFEDDLGVWMKQAGYRTMMVGKFLHADFMPYVPPGWDDFYHSLGGKYYATNRFTNRLDPNGRFELHTLADYRTTTESADVVHLINSHVEGNDGKPFFMYLNPLAPHRQSDDNPMMESRYARWWTRAQVQRLPDFNEANTSDKTSPLAALPPLLGTRLTYIDQHYVERLQTLKSVDDMLGALFQTLSEQDLMESTYIFLTSDNGFLLGHHRFFGKSLPLDRATRVPLLVIGPQVPQGEKANHLLAHIDIAATVADLAGTALPEYTDGVSFAPLLFHPQDHDEREWREPVLIQTWGTTTTLGYHEPMDIASTSIRYYDSIYSEWANGGIEFYELSTDPLQLFNAADQLSPEEWMVHHLAVRALKRPNMDAFATISKPFSTARALLPRQLRLAGMAEDDFGVQRVKLAIQDIGTRRYWNGSDWVSVFHQVSATTTNPGGQITEWHYQTNVPFSRVPDGPIRFWVWAIDGAGNFEYPATAEFEIDRDPPAAAFASPDNETTISGAFTASGTAQDNLAVHEIQLVVRRINDGRYWNGSKLQDAWTYVVPSRDADQWSVQLALPAGRYVLTLRALDESRNLASELPRRRITVH